MGKGLIGVAAAGIAGGAVTVTKLTSEAAKVIKKLIEEHGEVVEKWIDEFIKKSNGK